MELGKNLEEERESYHFTQKEVADILHVSRQTVSNWERDVSYPDLEVLIGAVIYGGMIVLLRPTSLDFIFRSIKKRK